MPSTANYLTPDPNLSPTVVLSCVAAGLVLIYQALSVVLPLPTPIDILLAMTAHILGPGARESLQTNFTLRNTTFGFGLVAAIPRQSSGEATIGGLWNVGNTCYQNSVLQALASLPSLKPYLRAIENGTTAEALERLIDGLNTLSGARAETPVAAITNPGGKGWGYNEQNDAQEYLQSLMGALEKEVERERSRRRQERLLGIECALLPEKDVSEEVHAANEIQNPFEGLLAQRVGCLRCNYVESICLQPFTTLSLPIPANQYNTTLEACLHAFTTLERIPQVECDKCTLLEIRQVLETLLAAPDISETRLETARKRLETVIANLEDEHFSASLKGTTTKITTTKTKQVMISRAPQILTLHTNRSVFDMHTGMIGKNYAAVLFPQILDLGRIGVVTNHESLILAPARTMSPIPARGPQYDLKSVVAHYGAHSNGHYITYRITEDGRWWRISDHEVDPCTQGDVLCAGNAFMLFYERLPESEERPYKAETLEEMVAEKLKDTGLMTPPPEERGREDEDKELEERNEEGTVVEEKKAQLETPPPEPVEIKPQQPSGKARRRKGRRK